MAEVLYYAIPFYAGILIVWGKLVSIGRSVGLVALLLALAPPSLASAAPQEPLGHAGRWITDAGGKVVVLHGFNTVPIDEQTLPRDMGMGPDNARWLARNGFNTIRLGLYYARVEPGPSVYDDAYLEDYLRVQRELARKGIFTLLGMHQDQLNPQFGIGPGIPSRGFPDWMIKDDGFPNTATPFPQGYFTNPALNRAYDNLWQDFDAPDGASVHDHFAEGWRRIAAVFKDRPGLLGYDIFNEPWPGTVWPTCANPLGCPPGGFDQTLLTAFNRKIAASLRAEDPEHVIFYEPNLQFDYGAQTQVGGVNDSNAGFSFHNYCLAFAAPGEPDFFEQCEIEERLVLENAEAHSARTGDALLLSELPFHISSVRRQVKLADEYMLSWQHWDYYGDHFDPSSPRAAALIRPYPQLIAGTPRRWSYDDASRQFELVYSTERAAGEGAVASAPSRFPPRSRTEVFVPDLHYPDGYGVELEGAEVASRRGARILVLRSCKGADYVRVRVSPERRPRTSCRAPGPSGGGGDDGGGGGGGGKGGEADPGVPGGGSESTGGQTGTSGGEAAGSAGGSLPFTGLALGELVALAVALTGLGAGGWWAARRRASGA